KQLSKKKTYLLISIMIQFVDVMDTSTFLKKYRIQKKTAASTLHLTIDINNIYLLIIEQISNIIMEEMICALLVLWLHGIQFFDIEFLSTIRLVITISSFCTATVDVVTIVASNSLDIMTIEQHHLVHMLPSEPQTRRSFHIVYLNEEPLSIM
ncbi:hypothetical protein RFI_39797, partial [Reticulomyxa filosa]